MFWKDQLAHEILSLDHIGYKELVGLQSSYPAIRIKSVDANSKVWVIQLNGKGEWWKPCEWARDHIFKVVQRHLETQQRLQYLRDDLANWSQEVCSIVDQFELHSSNDLARLAELEDAFLTLQDSLGKYADPDELNKLLRNYRSLLTIAKEYKEVVDASLNGMELPEWFDAQAYYTSGPDANIRRLPHR